MIKDPKYEAVEAYYLKTEKWEVKKYLNFFQFVYVISGNGVHNYSGNSIPFQEDYLVLLTPDKENYFELNGETEFLIMKVHLSYVRDYRWKTIDYLEELLFSSSQISGTIITNSSDKVLIKHLADSLIISLEEKKLYHQDLNLHYINALTVIAARNISEKKPHGFTEKVDNKFESILTYVEHNIYNPVLLRTQVVSEAFGISPNYFSSYFKHQSGENYKNYLANYKIKLIEHRLTYSDKRITELVDEFGFIDESHINKFYKRHKGTTIKAFRKAQKT
ncbi:AraC family transcriptional regulator [Formosa sp. L2A11]|uniref:helix-turn-helix domain-containing protein n=1 Tax=Formosa sp. L2A11 TaxID=2686363 RepID=UPI00131B01B4|nr:AraC family transcriptional regulator [Formosa sp. L2A11]